MGGGRERESESETDEKLFLGAVKTHFVRLHRIEEVPAGSNSDQIKAHKLGH